ncbi:MAG: hypothetical protein AAF907_10240, partial [Planctomycetota bacterium]
MNLLSSVAGRIYDLVLSPAAKVTAERITLTIALAAFVIHLGLIYAVDAGLVQPERDDPLLTDPIAAAYTPFSFILVYEVYLLVYYLPRSVSTYVGKQYEIATLIVIRKLFKDLANLDVSADWFRDRGDLVFTVDVAAAAALFLLLYVYDRLRPTRDAETNGDDHAAAPPVMPANAGPGVKAFVRAKMTIAFLLVPILGA